MALEAVLSAVKGVSRMPLPSSRRIWRAYI